jgi:type I phosphodiesterase/nucleotide pyrophosphatase
MRFRSALVAAGLLCSTCGAQTRHTRNVILVTADGLRWQELFGGIDPLLKDSKAAGMEGEQALRDRLWRPSAEERRAALLPFFWTTLAPRGVVLGNVHKRSSMRVTNAFRVSYPGYSEILTGRAQDAVIRGNDKLQNPTATVLEFVRGKLNLRASQVALFGSWEMFRVIGESRPGSIFINAGYQDFGDSRVSPRMRDLALLQFQVLTPWTEARHDYITFEMALDYLKTERPRFLYIALDETDDWAHDKRYNRVLDAVSYLDRCLRQLWEFIGSSPEYRNATTLVVTTDHGRGSTLDDWDGHGSKVPGADQIWAGFIGPDTPATGEAADAPAAFQRDIAPTILELTGIDYHEYQGVEGKPIALAASARAKR